MFKPIAFISPVPLTAKTPAISVTMAKPEFVQYLQAIGDEMFGGLLKEAETYWSWWSWQCWTGQGFCSSGRG